MGKKMPEEFLRYTYHSRLKFGKTKENDYNQVTTLDRASSPASSFLPGFITLVLNLKSSLKRTSIC